MAKRYSLRTLHRQHGQRCDDDDDHRGKSNEARNSGERLARDSLDRNGPSRNRAPISWLIRRTVGRRRTSDNWKNGIDLAIEEIKCQAAFSAAKLVGHHAIHSRPRRGARAGAEGARR